jgi:hypothetical protein
MVKVAFEHDIPEQRIRDLLTTALEGGSNYWYTLDTDRTVFVEGLKYEDFQEGGKCTDPENYHHPLELIPLTEGCKLCFLDKEEEAELAEGEEPTPHWLDRAKLLDGLKIMAQKYPRHFADLVNENDDAITGDVYLQCCLFGSVIYG